MVKMCVSAVWTSFLVVDLNPIPVHIFPDMALLCHSYHSPKRNWQGIFLWGSLSLFLGFIFWRLKLWLMKEDRQNLCIVVCFKFNITDVASIFKFDCDG